MAAFLNIRPTDRRKIGRHYESHLFSPGNSIVFLFNFLLLSFQIQGQTNPAAQSLPYSQNFSGLAWTATTYPAGWQGWKTGASASSSYRTTAPTADQALIASSSAATISGNVHNYNGKIGMLTTGTVDLAIALAINTIGSYTISVQYDVMTLRNPYDGSSNTRINESTLQYRVGTSGSFITLTGIEYQNNTTQQTSGTAPQNSQTKSITLPAPCENQSVVQLRWVMKDISGAGSRPSFAVDNISITRSTSPPDLTPYVIFEQFNPTTSDADLPSTTVGFTCTGSWITGSTTSHFNMHANSLKFTASGTLTTPIFSNGDMVGFWIENTGGSSNGSMDVQEYISGSWISVGTISSITNFPRMYFFSISTSATQLKFIFTYGTTDVCFDDVMVREAGNCNSNLSPTIGFILVNSCAGTEGNNEIIKFHTGNQSLNINNLIVNVPSVDGGSAGTSFCTNCQKTFASDPSYITELNTKAGCAVAVDPPGGIIPANSDVLVFTGLPDYHTYDFSNVCGSTYYTIFLNSIETSGRYSNKPGIGTVRHTAIINLNTGCYDQVYYDENIPDVDGELAYFTNSVLSSYNNFGCSKILPVELLDFSVICSTSGVLINWSTASETNNNYFTIEKSTNIENWNYVTTIKGAGNSNSVLNYSYTDYNALDNKSYYRLKQTDFDGKFEYFDPMAVLCNDKTFNSFSLYPNPVKDQVTCTFYTEVSSSFTIQILNSFGQIIYYKTIIAEKGTTNLPIDVTSAGNGIYSVILRSSDGNILESRRLVIY